MFKRTSLMILFYFVSISIIVKYLLIEIDSKQIDQYTRVLFNTVPLFVYNIKNQTRIDSISKIIYRCIQVLCLSMNYCFRELLSIENSLSLRIQGADSTKVRLLESRGLPYTYSQSELYSYPTIPYGNVYSILESPILNNLPNLTFVTLMLSRSCESSFRMKVRDERL